MSHHSIKNDVQAKLRRYEDLKDRKCLVEVVEIIFENVISQPELIPLLIGICKNHNSDDFITKFSEKAESSLRRIQSSERRNMMSNEDRNIIQLIGQLFINNLISIDTIKQFIHNLFQSIQDPTKWSSANESHVQLGIVLIRNIGCVIDISENGPVHFWFGILEHVEPFLGTKTREMIADLLKLQKNGWNREIEIDEKNAKIIELEQKVRGFEIDRLAEQQRQIHHNNEGGIQNRRNENLEVENERYRKSNRNLEERISALENELETMRFLNSEIENIEQNEKILKNENEELIERLQIANAEIENLNKKLEEMDFLNSENRTKNEVGNSPSTSSTLDERLQYRPKRSSSVQKLNQLQTEQMEYSTNRLQNQMKNLDTERDLMEEEGSLHQTLNNLKKHFNL